MTTEKINLKQLTNEEVEQFIKDGCLVVRNVFPKEIAGRIVPIVCSELKMDMDDPSTWPKHLVTLQKVLEKREDRLPSVWKNFTPVVVLRKELDNDLLNKIYTERYNGIIDDLCGQGRWKKNTGIGHWPILFPIFKGRPWQPLEGGWHIDGDFKQLNIYSGDCGLILMHIFTDIIPGGGGTAVRLGSHHFTSRMLAEAGPEGIAKDELTIRLQAATEHLPVKEIIGNNGDLLIMHPWVLHSSSLNTSEHFRIAANKNIPLLLPININRKKRSDFSPVELAIVNSIIGHGFNLPSERVAPETTEKLEQQKLSEQSLRHRIKRLQYFNLKDLIRIIALNANALWPFSKINKQYYEMAIKAFVKSCKKYPEINSVYLRHQLKDGNWTPALSDLDLTLIIKKDISVKNELRFLDEYWKNFKHLKRIYPIFGEIYLLNEMHFELWSKLEFEGLNITNWQLLSGNNLITHNVPQTKSFNPRDFDYAFSFYLNYIPGLFNKKGISSRLQLLDLTRVRNKIHRCLKLKNNNLTITRSLNFNSINSPKVEILNNILNELKQGLIGSPVAQPEINSEWKDELEKGNNFIEDNDAIDLNDLSPWSDNIHSIYLNYNKKIFIILKDGLDQQTFNSTIQAITNKFKSEKHLPVIFNINLFKYFLQHYEPFEYGHFMSYRTLAFGIDIIPKIAPPDKSAIVNYLIKNAAEIFKFPYSHKFLITASKQDTTNEFQHIFDVALMMKYYLDYGFVSPVYKKLLDSSYEAYPELISKMQTLKNGSDEQSHNKWFLLFKELADDIHKRIIANKELNKTQNEFPLEGTYSK